MIKTGVTKSAGVGKNPIIEAKTVTTLFKNVGQSDANRFTLEGNRNINQMDHQALTQKRYPLDLFPNSSAARKVLPCEPGYNSFRVIRPPPVRSENGMQVPTGFARGQRAGIMSQFPILNRLPIPITKNYQS